MTTTVSQPDLDVRAADALLRAAYFIARNGLAHDNYCLELGFRPFTDWPVDVLGAIALAVGLHPTVWEDDELGRPELVVACEAADMLVSFLGYNPARAYNETLGAWSDHQRVAYIVTMMRAAAREAVAIDA